MITPPQLPRNTDDLSQKLRMSIHACAISSRAVTKAVSFKYNYTGEEPSLTGLSVTGVSTKRTTTDESTPMWGYEKADNNLTIDQFQPLWGLINKSRFADSNALWTISGDYMYLPPTSDDGYDLNYGDSMVC